MKKLSAVVFAHGKYNRASPKLPSGENLKRAAMHEGWGIFETPLYPVIRCLNSINKPKTKYYSSSLTTLTYSIPSTFSPFSFFRIG